MPFIIQSQYWVIALAFCLGLFWGYEFSKIDGTIRKVESVPTHDSTSWQPELGRWRQDYLRAQLEGKVAGAPPWDGRVVQQQESKAHKGQVVNNTKLDQRKPTADSENSARPKSVDIRCEYNRTGFAKLQWKHRFYSLKPAACKVPEEMQRPFKNIYKNGVWSGKKISSLTPSSFYSYSDPQRWKTRVSSSGDGSNTGNPTKNSLKFVVDVIKEFNIKTMIDIPCGDVNWMMEAYETDSLHFYVGADITPSVIELNKERFRHHKNKKFVQWDFTNCSIPKVLDQATNCTVPFDLVHVRDVLQHLPLNKGKEAAQHLLSSGARFLISTTYPDPSNRDVKTGAFYHNNLLNPPFSFPKPFRCTPTHPGSENDETCLWKLS